MLRFFIYTYSAYLDFLMSYFKVTFETIFGLFARKKTKKVLQISGKMGTLN